MKRPNPRTVNPYDSKARKRTKSYIQRYKRIGKSKWFTEVYRGKAMGDMIKVL